MRGKGWGEGVKEGGRGEHGGRGEPHPLCEQNPWHHHHLKGQFTSVASHQWRWHSETSCPTETILSSNQSHCWPQLLHLCCSIQGHHIFVFTPIMGYVHRRLCWTKDRHRWDKSEETYDFSRIYQHYTQRILREDWVWRRIDQSCNSQLPSQTS